MIEFYGDFTESSKKRMLKNSAIVGFSASSIATLIFSLIIIIIANILDFWIMACFIFILILVVVVATAAPYIEKKKTLKLILPKRIIIDEDGIISIEMFSAIINKPISKIKKIVDEGECYIIKFSFPKLDCFLLQKDLIKKGTIDEFETMFQGKIIRNIK